MLAAAEVTRIAARHGFSDTNPTVTTYVGQANALHGRAEPAFDGDAERFWGCDAQGRYDARLLLDGYLAQGFRPRRADLRQVA